MDRPLVDPRVLHPSISPTLRGLAEVAGGRPLRSAVRRASDAVAVLSPMRRDVQVTGHRRAAPLLPEQAHASPRCIGGAVRGATAASPPLMSMCPGRPSYTSMADGSGLISGSGSDVGGGSAGECHHKRAEIT